LCIGVKQLLIVTVNHGEEEKIMFAKIFFNAADNHGPVSVANLFCDNTNRVSALQTQRAGKIIGAIVQLFGGGQDPLLGSFGDRSRCSGVIESRGNCTGRQIQLIGDSFQRYFPLALALIVVCRQRNHPLSRAEPAQ